MNHGIVIDNVKPNETLHYRFALIKGRIIKKENKQSPEKSEISAKINDKSVYVIILTGVKFKLLLELNLGYNELVIDYCCFSLNLTLNFEPRKTDYTVLPLYVICEGHDGAFQAPENEDCSLESACERITTCSQLLQCIIGEKLNEQQIGRKSFCLEDDCQIFRSKLKVDDVRKMKQEEVWKLLGQEIMRSSIGSENRKYLAFLSCTRYCGEKYSDSMETYEEIVDITEAYVALGGGGLALFGTACLFTWPQNIKEILERFEDNTPVDKTRFMDDSCYRGTYGACFSTTLGSVLHELCHTFDLGHTEDGVMGRGFDNIDKMFISKVEANTTITQTHQSNIEFKEKLDSGRHSERLQDVKKECCVQPPLRDEGDDTFWTRSGSVFLSYHKWFNGNNELVANRPSFLKYHPPTRFITSTCGIRVVEIRREADEFVGKGWAFDGRILRFSFQLPDLLGRKCLLVVEDSYGKILKEQIN